jgi:hypothetical protein
MEKDIYGAQAETASEAISLRLRLDEENGLNDG